MPHKHTRKKNDFSEYDLPPTEIARPLPVLSSRAQQEQQQQGGRHGPSTGRVNSRPAKRKRSKVTKDNDVPRAFKRLMVLASGKRHRSGLDNGTMGKKSHTSARSEKSTEKPSAPTIRSGESLFDFSARVDASLPLANLINKPAKGEEDSAGSKYRTRKERKMHKLYDRWREEEQKMKEKREERLELAAEEALDNGTFLMDSGVGFGSKNGPAGRHKKRKTRRADTGSDEDPWAELAQKRGEAKVGLRDVAQAPPELKNPGLKFRLR